MTRREEALTKASRDSTLHRTGFTKELKASSYDIQQFPGTFKSGRRVGMQLTSKQSGAPYYVFSRQDWVERDTAPPRTVLSRQQSSDADASAILNELYAEA